MQVSVLILKCRVTMQSKVNHNLENDERKRIADENSKKNGRISHVFMHTFFCINKTIAESTWLRSELWLRFRLVRGFAEILLLLQLPKKPKLNFNFYSIPLILRHLPFQFMLKFCNISVFSRSSPKGSYFQMSAYNFSLRSWRNLKKIFEWVEFLQVLKIQSFQLFLSS